MSGFDPERTSAGLREAMAARGKLIVAFSGGLDSSVVAALARSALGDGAVAVVVDSEAMPRREMGCARKVAGQIGIELVEVAGSELSDPDVRANTPDRCYFCRRGMVEVLRGEARRMGIDHIADGVIASDAREHRPGIRAATEGGVWHPLAETGLSKDDVRELARHLGLSISEKGSQACLSSRVPYGTPLDRRTLEMVERAEDIILGLGFRQVRVRHHGDTARIEVPRDDIPGLIGRDVGDAVVEGLVALGYSYVTVDLKGYRSGSMDEVLDLAGGGGGKEERGRGGGGK